MSIDQQELKERCDHLGKRVVAIEGRLAAVKAELKTECALWIGALQEELSEAKCACENRFDALVRRAYALDDLYDALEARCHELEHDGAKGVQEQIADLQERVKAVLAVVEVRYAPVGDRCDEERPVQPPQWRCPAINCKRPPQSPFDCSHRGEHSRNNNCGASCYGNRCVPVPASPEPAIPDQITIDSMSHMEPEPAIPDVPTPVGTEAFRRELQRHMRELSEAYHWSAEHQWASDILGIERLERLAGVACAIRDAYDLARVGEQDAAHQKLEEIEW